MSLLRQLRVACDLCATRAEQGGTTGAEARKAAKRAGFGRASLAGSKPVDLCPDCLSRRSGARA